MYLISNRDLPQRQPVSPHPWRGVCSLAVSSRSRSPATSKRDLWAKRKPRASKAHEVSCVVSFSDQRSRELHAILRAELSINFRELALDRTRRLAEPRGDGAVVVAFGHEQGDPTLVSGQALEQGERTRFGADGNAVDGAINQEDHAIHGPRPLRSVGNIDDNLGHEVLICRMRKPQFA